MHMSMRLSALLVLFVLLAAGCAVKTPKAGPSVKWVVSQDGSPIHYVDEGAGDMPLLLIHGWSCDLTFWREQIGPLSARTRVLALDLPGHGQSGAPKVRYTQERFADAVIAVMDRAGVEKAVLVGHSMGLSVIRQVALRHPERVAGLVIVDGAMFDVPEDEEGVRVWLAQMEAFVDNFRGPGSEKFKVGFIDSMHGRDTPDALKKEVREKVKATPDWVRVSAMEEFIDPANWRGGPVSVPTLAVYARTDELPPDFEASLQRMFPDLAYVLWDGPGHFLMMERGADLNNLVLDFLQRPGLSEER
jgi:pimeloyl-ACP methyl ester carboxylesterase